MNAASRKANRLSPTHELVHTRLLRAVDLRSSTLNSNPNYSRRFELCISEGKARIVPSQSARRTVRHESEGVKLLRRNVLVVSGIEGVSRSVQDRSAVLGRVVEPVENGGWHVWAEAVGGGERTK